MLRPRISRYYFHFWLPIIRIWVEFFYFYTFTQNLKSFIYFTQIFLIRKYTTKWNAFLFLLNYFFCDTIYYWIRSMYLIQYLEKNILLDTKMLWKPRVFLYNEKWNGCSIVKIPVKQSKTFDNISQKFRYLSNSCLVHSQHCILRTFTE